MTKNSLSIPPLERKLTYRETGRCFSFVLITSLYCTNTNFVICIYYTKGDFVENQNKKQENVIKILKI